MNPLSDDSTAAPCKQHCFCCITTDNKLRCHRCNATKPMEPPRAQTCLMCNGTGKTYQIRQRDDEFDIPESIL